MLGPLNGCWCRVGTAPSDQNGVQWSGQVFQHVTMVEVFADKLDRSRALPPLQLPTNAALFFVFLPLYIFFMPQNSKSASQTGDGGISVCTILGCNREFNTLHGLRIHQRTCATKQRERELNAEYEAQMEADHTAKAEGKFTFRALILLSVILTFCYYADAPPRVHKRVWENPVLRKQKDTVTPIFINSTYLLSSLLSLSSH